MRRYRSVLQWFSAAAVAAGVFAIMFAQAQGVAPNSERSLVPPPEPDVRPEITRPYDMDADGDKLDDVLIGQLTALRRAIATELDADKRADLMNQLNEHVGVELIFSKQITQEQINRFLGLGGQISRIFRAVSYGWNGSIPIGQLEQLPAAMGDAFLGAIRFIPLVKHMDVATQTGRVRPIWASGFAGGSGFSGSATTTIAVLDTGLDGTHTDLTGRMEYWRDWSASAEPSPVDYDGHGTHVTGMATGTGAAAGASPTTLYWTDSGNLTGVPSGSFYAAGITATVASSSYTGTAYWNGGGSTTLYWLYRSRGTNTGYTVLGSATGTTGLGKTQTFTGSTTRDFTTALLSNGAMSQYAVTNAVTANGLGDGYNLLRGVAPGCRWAGLKIYQNSGSGTTAEMGAALDDLVVQKSAHNIKVANLSSGFSGTVVTIRTKVNTVVSNGIVFCVSAGNSGPSTVVTDPARASLAVSVGSASDVNQLTDFTSIGLAAPGADEDYKPDVLAPGGSDYQSYIMSVDTNTSDAESTSFSDKRSNDYASMKGTSMASPFAAGCAALIVPALESSGTTWSWSSSSTSLLVKMLMCASATETNLGREGGTNNPTLGRGATPRDLYEGFGMLNPDAACEAASMTAAWATGITDTSAGGVYDRRAWGRKLSIENGRQVTLNLTMAAGADYDLYLYSSTPDAKGKPQILAYSCSTTAGTAESIVHTPSYTGTAYAFIKRVSGSGSFTFTPTQAAAATITVTSPNGAEIWQKDSTHSITWTYTGSPGSNVKIELYKAGSYLRTLTASTSVGSSGSGSYSWTVPTDLTAATDCKVNVASTTTAAADLSNSNFTIAVAATSLIVDAKSGQIGQTITLTATLVRSDDGRVIVGEPVPFTVAGTDAGSGTTNASGTASKSFKITEALGTGTKAIGASFAGGTIYGSSSGSATLTVSKSDTGVAVDAKSGSIGTTVTLTATLTRTTDSAVLAGKTVSFTVAGAAAGSGTTNASGVASVSYTITEALGAGTKTIGASFAGDTLYNSGSGSANLTVSKSDTGLAVDAKSGSIGATVTLTATLTRTTDSAVLAGKTVSFAVAGTAAGSGTTNASGVASVAYTIAEALGTGTKTIGASFAGDTLYNSNSGSANLTLSKSDTGVAVDAKSGAIGATVTLTATLTRTTDSAVLAGKTVSFTVAGTAAGSGTTNASGVASVAYTIPESLGIGTKTIGASFAGDALYNSNSGSANLTLSKSDTGVAVDAKLGAIGATVTLTATLTRTTDSAVLAGKTVSFTVAGTAAGSGTTNASGVASVSYTIAEALGTGTKTIGASFAGDTLYNSGSGSASLTVSKSDTGVAVDAKSGSIGATVTLTATLTRTTDSAVLAGKTVSFTVAGAAAGSGTTNASGVASVAYTIPESLGAGTKTIGASFAGDTLYNSGSGSANLTVSKSDTGVAVDAKSGSIGATVTLTATLTRTTDTAALAGKTVDFTVAGAAAGSGTTNASGVASVSYTIAEALGTGAKTIGAAFAGDDLHNASSGSADLTVGKADSAVAVDAKSGVIGETVTLTATLTRSSDSAALAGKSIDFTVAGAAAGSGTTNASGVASVSYTIGESLGTGTKAIGASFAGDDLHNASSGAADLTVGKADSTLVVDAKSGVIGETVTLTATLTRSSDSAALAGKAVDFTVEGAAAGSGTTDASGAASVSYTITEGLGVGTKTIGAAFAGDDLHNASSGTADLTVGKADSAVAVDAKSGEIGETVTLTATLTRSGDSAALAGKTVDFTVAGAAAGSCTTNASGVASVSYTITEGLGVGTKTIGAAFAGDDLHNASSGSADLTVGKADSTLAVDAQSGVIGETVTLTATLTRSSDSAALAGKTVDFTVAGAAAGSGTTNASGVASVSYTITEALGVGTKAIGASFAGDDIHNASSGAADLTVGKADSTLVVDAKSGVIGETVTLTATLTRSSDTAALAGKTVDFTVAGAAVGSGTTNASGVASVSYTITEGLGVGTKTIGAAFAGDDLHNASSGGADLAVSKADSTLTVDAKSGVIGETVTLTATLTRSSDSAALAGRTVDFTVEGAAAGSGTTDASGVASVSFAITEALGNGVKAIGASFAGDDRHNASSGTADLTVGKAGTALAVSNSSGAIGETVALTATLTRTSDGAGVSGRSVAFTVWSVVQGTSTTNGAGVASLDMTIPYGAAVGDTEIAAEFAGDETNGGCSGTGTLTVEMTAANLVVADTSGRIGQTVALTATLTQATDGAPLSGQSIAFTVDGTAVGSATTNGSGVASLSCAIPLAGGTGAKTIGASFAGDASYMAATDEGTLTVLAAMTSIYAMDRAGVIGDTVALKALLKRAYDNQWLSGQTLSFSVDGVSVGSGTTNTSGMASAAYTIPEGSGAGTRPISVAFAGSDPYAAGSGSAALTVSTSPTTMWTIDRSARIGETTVLKGYLYRTLDRTMVRGKTIAFTVEGTGVGSATTTATGCAALAYAIPDGAGAGARSFGVSFAGDAGHGASSATGTITVSTASVTIWVLSRTILHNQSAYLRGYLRRTCDYAWLAGKSLTFKLDGVDIGTASTNGSGMASVLYTAPSTFAGSHPLVVEFAGDAWYQGGVGTGTVSGG